MERSERAKQFMPFDALTGLRKKLAAVEERHSRVERAVLDEEATKVISAFKTFGRKRSGGVYL